MGKEKNKMKKKKNTQNNSKQIRVNGSMKNEQIYQGKMSKFKGKALSNEKSSI